MAKLHVSWKADRLFLNSRVDVDRLQIALGHHPGFQADTDRLWQQAFQSRLANPLAENAQARRFNRQAVLEIDLAAEMLKIRTFPPAKANLLIRNPLQILEHQQASPRSSTGQATADRRAGPANMRRIMDRQILRQTLPVHQDRQLDQFVPHVDNRVQTRRQRSSGP